MFFKVQVFQSPGFQGPGSGSESRVRVQDPGPGSGSRVQGPGPGYRSSPFCSQYIQVFIMTFWSCRKKGLIRKISLTSKFMTSQPGYQTITIHILPNISRSKDNQTVKLGELTEYNKRNILLQKIMQKMRQGD